MITLTNRGPRLRTNEHVALTLDCIILIVQYKHLDVLYRISASPQKKGGSRDSCAHRDYL